jgi:hypothetical protein
MNAKDKKLVEEIVEHCRAINQLKMDANRKLGVIRRDIGELVVRRFSPSAAAERRKFDDLPLETREKFRKDIDGRNRQSMVELAEALSAAGVTEAVMSVNTLYVCARLAICYTSHQIASWVDRGMSMTNLAAATAMSSREDMDRALETAIETEATAVDDFRELVDNLVANGAMERSPASAAAKKAAATKKKSTARIGPPEDALTPLQRLEKFSRLLDSRLREEIDNTLVMLTNEYDDLDSGERDRIQEVLRELKLPLEATRASIDGILEYLKKEEIFDDSGSGIGNVGTGRTRARRRA